MDFIDNEVLDNIRPIVAETNENLAEDRTVSKVQHNQNDDVVDEEVVETSTEEVGNIDPYEAEPIHRKRSFLSNIQRDGIAQILTNESHDGKLKRGTVAKLALFYSVSIKVIYRIWKQKSETGNVCHKKTKNYGRKRIEIDIEKVRDVALNKRSTYRALGRALGVNKNKLLIYKKEGVLRRHSSGLKPHLKEDNIKGCLRFCLSILEESSIPHDPMFKSMYNIVHIDKKWFYMSQKTKNYYLLANEDDPYRTCKNKNYISKVMFLVAVARPRFDDDGNKIFSGKIGMWPLVNEEQAIRSSVNRPSGTLVTKPITSITKGVSKMFLINKVLPAIKEKWSRECAREIIYIQQDNAPCHVAIDDEEFCRAASEGGFNIRLICQPPNSPNFNVLDLGFFSAIQSLQQMEVVKTVNELIQVVQNAFENFSSKDSNKIFLTLQSCMIEIMKAKGSNHYKIPHMKKNFVYNRDNLPIQLKCDSELVQATFEYLHNFD